MKELVRLSTAGLPIRTNALAWRRREIPRPVRFRFRSAADRGRCDGDCTTSTRAMAIVMINVR